MKLDSPRALVARLIAAELLARPGTGPLAPRYFRGPHTRGARARPATASGEPDVPRGEPDAPRGGGDPESP